LAHTGPLRSELRIFIAAVLCLSMTCPSQCVPEFCKPRWHGVSGVFPLSFFMCLTSPPHTNFFDICVMKLLGCPGCNQGSVLLKL